MKIKKTLFSTEIEFDPEELESLSYRAPTYTRVGLLFWFKKMFGLDMLPKPEFKPKEKNDS